MAKPDPNASLNTWAQAMEAQMEEQRSLLRLREPELTAQNSGAALQALSPEKHILSLAYFGQPLTITLPGYDVLSENGTPAPTMTQALVLTYLVTADGMPRGGHWVAFRDLPNGAFYHQAFTGYTGNALAGSLGNDREAFERGGRSLGGGRLNAFGDAAFEFRVMPNLWLAAVYWLGDEEDGFPPQANILFDSASPNYMITDGLAIIGSQLTRKIIAGAKDGSG